VNKILELGVGNNKKYNNSIGLDIINTINTDIVWDLEKTPMPFEDNDFDMVYCSHVLEHIDNLYELLKDIYRILKPKGLFIINVPHFSHWGAFADPTHKRFFATNTFDYFIGETRFNYGTKINFKKIKTRIDWDLTGKIFNTILSFFINLNTFIYERFLCWILPSHNIYFEFIKEKEV